AEVQLGDGLEVQQRATGAIGVDVGLVHLDDVGGVPAGGLGGELVPVPGPFAVLGRDGDIVLTLLEQVERLPGEGVAQVAAPPVDLDVAALLGIGGIGAA